jgi:hypothetical protein
MASYEWPPGIAGGAGVTSLNSLTGPLSLVAGSGISITPSGSNITIAATGGAFANQSLSNLTSPTAINQSLLFSSDGSFNIGASLATRPGQGFFKSQVTIGDSTASGTLQLIADSTLHNSFIYFNSDQQTYFEYGGNTFYFYADFAKVWEANSAAMYMAEDLLFLNDNTNALGNPSFRPASVTVGTFVTSPLLQGSTVAGSYTAYSATTGVLNLSSTSNASKAYVQITDGSLLQIGDVNAITADLAGTPGPGGAISIILDGAGHLLSSVLDNAFEIDVYGAAPVMGFGVTGGTVASPTYVTNGAIIANIVSQEWNGSSPQDKSAAGIRMAATENHSSSAFGTEIVLQTTPAGTTTKLITFTAIGNSCIIGPSGATGQHTLNTSTATPATGVGTFTNLPTGYSGNPTGYIQITINGGTHVIPYW